MIFYKVGNSSVVSASFEAWAKTQLPVVVALRGGSTVSPVHLLNSVYHEISMASEWPFMVPKVTIPSSEIKFFSNSVTNFVDLAGS